MKHVYAVHACVRCLFCSAIMKSARLAQHEEELHAQELGVAKKEKVRYVMCKQSRTSRTVGIY